MHRIENYWCGEYLGDRFVENWGSEVTCTLHHHFSAGDSYRALDDEALSSCCIGDTDTGCTIVMSLVRSSGRLNAFEFYLSTPSLTIRNIEYQTIQTVWGLPEFDMDTWEETEPGYYKQNSLRVHWTTNNELLVHLNPEPIEKVIEYITIPGLSLICDDDHQLRAIKMSEFSRIDLLMLQQTCIFEEFSLQ